MVSRGMGKVYERCVSVLLGRMEKSREVVKVACPECGGKGEVSTAVRIAVGVVSPFIVKSR